MRALMYSVQFRADPVDGLEPLLERVMTGTVLDADPREYLAALRAALASDETLSALLPQEHDEATIRRYLAEFERRLAARLGLTDA
jgi:hypothetical protein